MEVTYFHAYIDRVDFVFLDSPIFRHIGNDIYGGNRMVNPYPSFYDPLRCSPQFLYQMLL